MNTEVGVTVYPLRRVGLSTGYRYRMMWFDTASGVTDTHGSAAGPASTRTPAAS